MKRVFTCLLLVLLLVISMSTAVFAIDDVGPESIGIIEPDRIDDVGPYDTGIVEINRIDDVGPM